MLLLFPPLGKVWNNAHTLKEKFRDGEDFYDAAGRLRSLHDFKIGDTVQLMSGGGSRVSVIFTLTGEDFLGSPAW